MQFFRILIIVKEALKQNRKRKIDNKTKVAACVITAVLYKMRKTR